MCMFKVTIYVGAARSELGDGGVVHAWRGVGGAQAVTRAAAASP